MRIFVTGASGWIGTAAVDELHRAGHTVLGLARNNASATHLQGKGAEVIRGDLDDLGPPQRGARETDAVLHLANKHDWANPAESNRDGRAVIQTLADALIDSDKQPAIASGLLRLQTGQPALEADASPAVGPASLRGGSENLALNYVAHGARSIALKFAPTVQGTGDHGFVSQIVAAAQRTDAAHLARLALERAPAGAPSRGGRRGHPESADCRGDRRCARPEDDIDRLSGRRRAFWVHRRVLLR